MRLLFTSLLILSLILSPATMVAALEHSHGKVTETTDLAADGKLAGQGRMPILLLISQEHCSFCHQIKQEILQPMIKAGDYRGRLLIRELFMDPGVTITGFDGVRMGGAEWAYRHGIDLTPTLLFLAPDGQELTERIIGVYTPDMFFYYVNESIKTAIDRLANG